MTRQGPDTTESSTTPLPSLRRLAPLIVTASIVVVAFLLRLLFIAQTTGTPLVHGLAMDTGEYDQLALRVLQGDLFHGAFLYLNPLYPFFLSAVYAVFGHHALAVQLVQALLDSLSCALIAYLGARAFGRSTGWLAAGIYALYGIAIFYSGILLGTTLVLFLGLLFAALLCAAEARKGLALYAAAGCAFGLTVLGRPNLLLAAVALPVWLFWTPGTRGRYGPRLTRLGLFVVGLAAVLTPVAARNARIADTFSPFSVQGGINFYIGNHPHATGRFVQPPGISRTPVEQVHTSIRVARQETGQALTPSQASGYWFGKGLTFLRDNPVAACSLYARKAALFWRKEEIPLNINYQAHRTLTPMLRLPFFSFGFLAPLAVIGMGISAQRPGARRLVTLLIVAFMLALLPFFMSARYRLPVVPFLAIYASATLIRLASMLRARQVRDAVSLAAVVAALALGVNMPLPSFALPSDTEPAHYNLALAYARQGRLHDAAAEYGHVLRISPGNAGAHVNVGLIYYRLGQMSEAEAECRVGAKLEPDNARAHYNLALILGERQAGEEALEAIDRALALRPDYVKALYQRGVLLAEQKRWAEAAGAWTRVLALDPNHEAARRGLAALRQRPPDVFEGPASAMETAVPGRAADPPPATTEENQKDERL